MLKILYFGVFDGQAWRAEHPMAESLEALGHQLFKVNFRKPFGAGIRSAWEKHFQSADLVFLQNGIPFREKHLALFKSKPFVFFASEYSVSSATHILNSDYPPDLVFSHSIQTHHFCIEKGIQSIRMHHAFNPHIYYLDPLPFKYDIAFIGGMTPKREKAIQTLKQAGFNIFSGKVKNVKKINQIYNQSKIILHVHAKEETYVPLRLFEVMPTQGCLLIEDMGDNLDEHIGNDFYEMFYNFDEMVTKAKMLLTNEGHRQRLVSRAHEKSQSHNLSERMKTYSDIFKDLVHRHQG